MPRQLVLASKQSGARLAEGWLEKMARSGKKRWSTRWFKITATGDIAYFARKADLHPKGMVKLCILWMQMFYQNVLRGDKVTEENLCTRQKSS